MIENIIYFSENAFLKTYVIEYSSYIQNGDENTWQPKKRPAVIICPGGGYRYIADSEDEPVMYHFLTKGYSCFSLHYSVGEDSQYPTPLIELFKSIKYVREHCNEYRIDENAIILCGFSAGAHLVGLASVKCDLMEIQLLMNCDNSLYRPNAAILCYPITNISKLKNEKPQRVKTWGAMLQDFSGIVDVVNYVTPQMCPVFLWHTRTDGIVPVEQSLELIELMEENEVPFECHIFGEGFHGLSTNDVLSNYKGAVQNGVVVPNVDRWIEMAAAWINYIFGF